MATSTINTIIYYLDEYWDKIADPRVNNFPLIHGGIWKILTIMGFYLVLTRILLPKYMSDKKPFELRRVMFIYNFIMVGANLFAFYWAIRSIDYGRIFLDFKFPSRDDRSPMTMWYLYLGWWFWMSRFIDLFDTLFLVLRKKDNQISILHLYHHTVVPILCWVSFKYNAMIPIIRMFVVINSFIHVSMYSYYALALFGPKVQRFLWWKKYITQMQILQFLICGSYGAILYFAQNDYPKDWFYFVVGQNPLFFYMFYDFYKNSYTKHKKT